MSPASHPPSIADSSTVWIDGCGGFRLFRGGAVSIGGWAAAQRADIVVRGDLPRQAGEILRRGGDYFWAADDSLLADGCVLPTGGSGKITFHRPTALVCTAVIRVSPPQRLDGSIDAAILAESTVLIGPGSDDHIRCPELDSRAVLQFRDGIWTIRRAAHIVTLAAGVRQQFDDLSITLERS